MAFKGRTFLGSFKVLIVLTIVGLILGYFAILIISENGFSPISLMMLAFAGLPVYYWYFKSV